MDCPACYGKGSTGSWWNRRRCKKCKGKGKIGVPKRRSRRVLRGKARKHPISIVRRRRRRAL